MNRTPSKLEPNALGNTPQASHHRSPAAALQGRSPLAPMHLLHRKSPNKSMDSLHNKSAAEVGEDLVRALRKDLLEIQMYIDTNSSRNVLSYDMRRLETELLGITGSAESQALKLLKLLQEKSKEVHAMMPEELLPAPAAAAAAGSGPATSPGGLGQSQEMLLMARASPVVGSSSSTVVPVVKPLLEVAKALKDAAEAGGFVSASQIVGEFSGSESDQLASTTRSGGARSVGAHSRSPQATPRISRKPSETGNNANDELLPLAPSAPKPLTGNSLAHLRSMGVDISDEEAANPNIDSIINKVAVIAKTVISKKGKMDKRFEDTRDASLQRQRQQQLELDALHHKLAEKDIELQDIRRQLASSRFGSNQQRSLTTVHDAPMSFEVERQYQRDQHRANLRISELERDYKKLFDDGIDDRQKVKDLTQETYNLREEISKMNRLVAKLEEDKEENHSLFVGVSKTRGEEARMCSVAVKQLEGRVAELQHDLRDSRQTNEYLIENLSATFKRYLDVSDELKKKNEAHEDLDAAFDDYKSVYNTQLMERLEKTQRQLLQVYAQCDEQEAHITILKQQLDDHEQQKNITVQETQKLMEKFKGSTEFKLLGVRAPDETKQLAVRLVVLQGDKEKKESSTAAQHGERLAVFKNRAEKEVKDRIERRKNEANLVNAKSFQDTLKGKELTRARQRVKDAEVAKKSERPGPQTVAEDYLEECQRRVVAFNDYYDDRYPPDDY